MEGVITVTNDGQRELRAIHHLALKGMNSWPETGELPATGRAVLIEGGITDILLSQITIVATVLELKV